MSDKLVIKNLPPYDGEYEFDVTNLVNSFTMGELHRIKKMTGLRAGELGEAFDAGDTDLIAGLTVVILERNGQRVVDDLLWQSPHASIRVELGADDGPPEKAQEPKKTRRASGKSGNENSDDSPESGPSPTGDPS